MRSKLFLISILIFSCTSIFSQNILTKADDYYSGISPSLTGNLLKAALHNLIDGHTVIPYDSDGIDVLDIIKESDKDPDPGYPDNVILVYTGRSQDKLLNIVENTDNSIPRDNKWSREHIWAKIHGDFMLTPPAGTDIHNLKPCDNSVNNDRNQLEFDNGGQAHGEAIGCFYDTDSWEPGDAVKGDVARIMFYMATRYEGDIGGSGDPDLEIVDNTNNTNSTAPVHGKLSSLLAWNANDPPDDFERNRNDVIYSYQGNRNPFIDHPEYAAKIWAIDYNIVINEFLASPADDLSGDANGDGITDAEDDEFVEIYNNPDFDVDISGWTLSDTAGIKHIFTAGTILSANSCIVVFGGGSPTGDFGGALVQTASSGALGLDNNGDDIILHDGSIAVDLYTYGNAANNGESLTRDPDITGGFERHSLAAGSGGTLFSPGKKLDGSPLPVELVSFTACVNDEGVILNWETATEVNNYGFEIERFAAKSSYLSNQYTQSSAEEWEKIAFVEGHGNSNSPKYYSLEDKNVLADNVKYRLKQIDIDGGFEYSDVIECEIESAELTLLKQNYPNPFNPSTIIEYRIHPAGTQRGVSVQLRIYDILGNEIVKLVNEKQRPGRYKVVLDAAKYNLASGVYYYSLISDSGIKVKKMLFLK
ncbi:MAG: endonuclease [Melioribacteraceae bacterium]|nr:endonuclease [Melioribacteraceae bacterium]